MKFEPVKDIPIPKELRKPSRNKPDRVWDFEVLTERGMSKFFPGKTTRMAFNSLYGFKKKFKGLYKKRTYTIKTCDEVDGDGQKIKGVRVWRTDNLTNTPKQNALLQALLNPPPIKRITQTDIHRSIQRNGSIE